MKHISEVMQKKQKENKKKQIKPSKFVLICFTSLFLSLICVIVFLWFDAANLVVEFDSPIKVNEIIEKHRTEKNEFSSYAVIPFFDSDYESESTDVRQLFFDISNYQLNPIKKTEGLFISLLLNKHTFVNGYYLMNETYDIDFSVHDVNGKIYLACVFPDSNDPDADSILTSIYQVNESDNAIKDLSCYKEKEKSTYGRDTVYQYVFRFFERFLDAEIKDFYAAVSISFLFLNVILFMVQYLVIIKKIY